MPFDPPMLRLIALVLLAAACTPSRGFLEIEQPAYWWRADDGLCGHNMVVDRDHVLWGEGGCETGPQDLEKRSDLSPDEFDALVKSFAGLPKEPPPYPRECQGVRHQFSIGQRDTGRVWSICTPRTDFWDDKGIPAPYRDVVLAFKRAATRD
jgi:hypothetical protein